MLEVTFGPPLLIGARTTVLKGYCRTEENTKFRRSPQPAHRHYEKAALESFLIDDEPHLLKL